jgi:hypothetical protein
LEQGGKERGLFQAIPAFVLIFREITKNLVITASVASDESKHIPSEYMSEEFSLI